MLTDTYYRSPAPIADRQPIPAAKNGHNSGQNGPELLPFDDFIAKLFLPEAGAGAGAETLFQRSIDEEATTLTKEIETTPEVPSIFAGIDLTDSERAAVANKPNGLLARTLANKYNPNNTSPQAETPTTPLVDDVEIPDATVVSPHVQTNDNCPTNIRSAFKSNNTTFRELAKRNTRPTKQEILNEHYEHEILRARSEGRVAEIEGSPVDNVVREIHRRLKLGYKNRDLEEFSGFLDLVNQNFHTLTQLQQAQTRRLIDDFSMLMDEALYQPTLYDKARTQAMHAYDIAQNTASSVVSATQNVAIIARERLHNRLGIIPLEEAVVTDSEPDAVDIITQQYESNISTDVQEVATEDQANRVVLDIQNQLVQYLGSDDRIAFNNTVFRILEDFDDYTTIELQHIQNILENIAQLFEDAYEEWHPTSLYQWAHKKASTMIVNLPIINSTIIENIVDYSLLDALNEQVQYRQFGTTDLRIEPAITTRVGLLEPGFLRRSHPDNAAITNLSPLFPEPFVTLPTPAIKKEEDPVQLEIDTANRRDAIVLADEISQELRTVTIEPETNITHLMDTGTNLMYLFNMNSIHFIDPYEDSPTELARAEITAGAMYQEMFTTLLDEPEAIIGTDNRRRTTEFFQALMTEYHFHPSNDYAVALLINTMRADVENVRGILENNQHLNLDDIFGFTNITLKTIVAELKEREKNNTLQLDAGGDMHEIMKLLIISLTNNKSVHNY